MKLTRGLLFILTLAFATPAFAYYSVMDNGEILAPGKYKLTGEAQFMTDPSGLNAGARFDMALNDEMGLRAMAGFGKIDFFLGALFKWMPVPDLEKQPAIGFNAGVLYGSEDGDGELTLRFEPLISKKFEVNFGFLTPYASVPLGLRMRNADRYEDDKTDLTSQLAIGTQLQLPDWQNLQFMAELGFELDNSYSYISGAAVFYFDEEGFELK